MMRNRMQHLTCSGLSQACGGSGMSCGERREAASFGLVCYMVGALDGGGG